MEAKLVPAAGFPIEWVNIGGLKRVGLLRTLQTMARLPVGVLKVLGMVRRRHPAAVFSMGGFAAGPAVLAACIRGLPLVIMEPNAMPGFTNRKIGRFVDRALLSFEEAARHFPAGKGEITGLPVRREFFEIASKAPGEKLTVLITGGSRGARTLNNALADSLTLFGASAGRVRIIHQSGSGDGERLRTAFQNSGLEGKVVPFIDDMPAAFAEADLVVCRSGAGAVAELAAAGKPSILVPFPFAADDHQLRNAQALANAGAAILIRDGDMTGERLHREILALADDPGRLTRMGESARKFARPGAAERAADLLEELTAKGTVQGH